MPKFSILFQTLFLGLLATGTLAIAEARDGLSKDERDIIRGVVGDGKHSALLRSPNGRVTLIVGENHFVEEKQKAAVKSFPLVGVEAPDIDKYIGGSAWGALILLGRKGFNTLTGGNLAAQRPNVENDMSKHKSFLNDTIRNLEFDHVPDWREQSLSAGGTGLFLSLLTMFAGDISKTPCKKLLEELGREEVKASKPIAYRMHQLGTRVVQASKVTLWISAAALLLGFPFDSDKSSSGISGNRNVTMAKAASEWDNTAEKALPMVILVGPAHVGGIAYHLKEKHGYREIDLDR